MSVQLLIDLLEQLDLTHINMLELAQQKKKIIIENNVESLIHIMNQETKVLKQIEQLEEQRAGAAHQFLNESGIKSKLNLNVSELSRLVFDIEEKRKLLDVQTRLSNTLKLLKQANDLNQKLIEQSLLFIDFSLEVMVGKPNQEIIYKHPSERSSVMGRPGYFDSRA